MVIISHAGASGRPLFVSDGRERLLLAAGLAVFFLTGYFGIGFVIDPTRLRDLASPLDERIPFVSHAVWVYVCIFPAALSPLVLVRDNAIFRRTALAYAIAMTVSFSCFFAFPITSRSLRVPIHDLDPSQLSDRVVELIYALDPPTNLFPSLHLSIVVLAVMSLWRAGKITCMLAAAGAFAIGGSVCLIKQHFIVDAAGGLALGALIGRLALLQRHRRVERSTLRGS
jgi:membrane-associated phospholipid phosphatase